MADGRVEIDTRINQDGINKGVKEVKDKLSKVGDGLKNVGESMNKYVTLPLMAMAGGALKVASDFNTSQAQIQNSLGLTANEAGVLNEAVKNVWKEGFGASLAEVTNSLLEVKQNMKGLNDGDIEDATKNAMLLAQTFDADVNEVSRAGGQLMSEFGDSADKAFDLMAHGAQNGLNFSKEMFDNIAEYAPLFAEAGWSSDEMFQALIKGAQEGSYNLDYLNDVVKEFGNFAEEGTKGFVGAMEQLSPKTQAVWKDFQNGKATIKDVMDSAIGDLNGMDDKVAMNRLGLELFGTKWEDLGADAVLAMGGITGEIENVDGKMQGMVETQEQTFGQRFQSTLRNLLTALEPLGTVLLDMAEQWMPKIASAVQTVSNWFSNLSPAVQTLVVIFGAVAAVLGPVITVLGIVVGAVSNLIGPIMTAVGWFSKLSALGPVLSGALSALAGPIGIVIAIIGGLIAIGIALYKNWDEVMAYAGKLASVIAEKFEAFRKAIATKMEEAKKKIEEIWGKVMAFFNGIDITGTAKKIFTTFINGIGAKINDTVNKAKELWKGVTGFIDGIDIKDKAKKIFTTFVNGIGDKISDTRAKVEELWDEAQSFFDDIDLVQTGKDIINGLISGIGSMASALWDKAKSIASGIKDTITSAFEINSPSRWMRDFVAGNLYKGFEVGVDKQATNFKGTTEQMTNLMMPRPEQLVRFAPNGMSSMINNLQQMLSLKIMLDSETIGYAVTPVVAREIAFEARG